YGVCAGRCRERSGTGRSRVRLGSADLPGGRWSVLRAERTVEAVSASARRTYQPDLVHSTLLNRFRTRHGEQGDWLHRCSVWARLESENMKNTAKMTCHLKTSV